MTYLIDLQIDFLVYLQLFSGSFFVVKKELSENIERLFKKLANFVDLPTISFISDIIIGL